MDLKALQNKIPVCDIPDEICVTSLRKPAPFLKWLPQCLGKRLLIGDFRVLEPWCLAIIAALSRRQEQSCTYPVISKERETGRFAYSLGLGEFTGDGSSSYEEAGRTVKLHAINEYSKIDDLADRIASLTLSDNPQNYIDPLETKETLKYIIVELLRNVIQHSFDKCGGVVLAQRMDKGDGYENNQSVQLCVVDQGIGIAASLKKMHTNIADNDVALERAIWPSFSGTFPEGGSGTFQNAGMGLFFISEIVKRVAGRLLIASGETSLFLEGKEDGTSPDIRFLDAGFDGTIVAVDIPKRCCADFEELLKKVQQTAFERSPGKVRVRHITFNPPDLSAFLTIKMRIGNEDTYSAEMFSNKYLLPNIKAGKALCLDFSGYKIATQSFIHAVLYASLKEAHSLGVPLAVINASPALRDMIDLLEWYALSK